MIKACIVDDEKLVRKGIITIMPWNKFSIEVVAEASNGVRALEIMSEQQIDLLFTDLNMPEMDGMQLIREVKETYPNVQIVILTCHPEFEYVQEALRLGAIDYILKTQLENDLMEDMLQQIVTRYYERLSMSSQPKPVDINIVNKGKYPDEIVQSIVKTVIYMQEQHEMSFTQEHIAKVANMSRGYFSQCFKDIMGTSFHKYLKNMRLTRSKKLLLSTNRPIYDIALQTGFKDEKYFSRQFLLEVGMLPSDFRNQDPMNL
ncbi:response regulator transcription factor [Paenibacillus endoradicis]|uniref:response regulator transcription factor n=1 Tax=Paenibacillus endoradicis TaxID=2972487 RepID=UPI002158FE06|nr:response regulator [Paenibacillus endoradicis]MCR8658689.1 response regulator [Paenibacillus endoradicis]